MLSCVLCSSRLNLCCKIINVNSPNCNESEMNLYIMSLCLYLFNITISLKINNHWYRIAEFQLRNNKNGIPMGPCTTCWFVEDWNVWKNSESEKAYKSCFVMRNQVWWLTSIKVFFIGNQPYIYAKDLKCWKKYVSSTIVNFIVNFVR